MSPDVDPAPSNRLSNQANAALAFAALPIIAFYTLLCVYMRNVPIMDDYHAIMEFVLILKRTPGFGSKLLWVLAAQHNDYKFVFLNLVVIGQWLVTGRINFIFLILIGNVMQLGILWIYWKHSFTTENLSRRILLFLPVVFLLMQLNGVENLDWAITDMEKIPAILFSFISLHWLLKHGRHHFALACGFAVLAYFASANGFMIAPIGFLLLIQRRKWAQVIVWTIAVAAAVGVYLYKYVPFGVSQSGSAAPFSVKPVFYLSLLGAGIENMSRFPVKGSAIVLGAVLLGLFVHATWRHYYRHHPFAYYSTVWVLLTCALITQGRSLLGILLSLTGRYKIFSDLMMVFGYVYAVRLLNTAKVPERSKRMLYAGVLGVSVLFAAGSDYFGYKFLLNRQERDAAGLDQYEADPSKNVPMVSLTDQPIPQAEPEHDRLVLTEALKSGIYKIPPPGKR